MHFKTHLHLIKFISMKVAGGIKFGKYARNALKRHDMIDIETVQYHMLINYISQVQEHLKTRFAAIYSIVTWDS